MGSLFRKTNKEKIRGEGRAGGLGKGRGWEGRRGDGLCRGWDIRGREGMWNRREGVGAGRGGGKGVTLWFIRPHLILVFFMCHQNNIL